MLSSPACQITQKSNRKRTDTSEMSLAKPFNYESRQDMAMNKQRKVDCKRSSNLSVREGRAPSCFRTDGYKSRCETSIIEIIEEISGIKDGSLFFFRNTINADRLRRRPRARLSARPVLAPASTSARRARPLPTRRQCLSPITAPSMLRFSPS